MTDRNAKLDALLTDMTEGELTDASMRELRDLVLADPAAMQRYLETLEVTAALAWANNPISAELEPTTEPPAPSIPIYRKGYEPKPSRFRPYHYAITAIAAALLAACGVAIYAYFSPVPHSPIPDPTSQPVPIATLIDSTDAFMVNSDIGNPGHEYGAGSYGIEAGSAELQLTSGANVRVFGRTGLRLHNAMSATLAEGYARFRCPPSAHGYTVHLPGGASAIDLGTAFDVDVQGDAYTVTVSEGLVGFVPGPDAEVAYLLEAGASVAVDASGTLREPTATVASNVRTIASVETNTANPWIVVPGGFGEDVVALVGRPAQWNGTTEAGLPAELVGHDMVRAARDDSGNRELSVKLTLVRPAVVYVLWNSKVDPADWLTADYEKTDLVVGLDATRVGRIPLGVGPGQSIDVQFHVWRRTVAEPGVIELGPNGNPPKNGATYGVVAAPLDTSE